MHRRDGTIDARATIFRREDTGFQPARGNPEALNQTIERRNEMIDENDAMGSMGETKGFIGGMQECIQTIHRRGRRRENSAQKGPSRVRRREGACAVLRPHVSRTQGRVLTIEAPVRSSEACLPIKGRWLRLIGVSTRPFDLALGLRVAEEAGLKAGVVRTDGQQAAREKSSVCAARAAGGSRSRDAGARCRALLRRDFGGAPGALRRQRSASTRSVRSGLMIKGKVAFPAICGNADRVFGHPAPIRGRQTLARRGLPALDFSLPDFLKGIKTKSPCRQEHSHRFSLAALLQGTNAPRNRGVTRQPVSCRSARATASLPLMLFAASAGRLSSHGTP